MLRDSASACKGLLPCLLLAVLLALPAASLVWHPESTVVGAVRPRTCTSVGWCQQHPAHRLQCGGGRSSRGALSMKAGGGSDVLPKDKLLAAAAYGGVEKEVATRVMEAAGSALRNWELTATEFLTPPEYSVMMEVLGGLVDLQAVAWGGHEEAERRRLFFARDGVDLSETVALGVVALEIGGQFLFDMAEHRDYLGSVLGTGIERQKVGDILVQGERGAQLLCHPDIADYLCSNLSSVRSVTVKVSRIPMTELKVAPVTKKQVTSVEASLRLDAVGSAGMGISRSKMADAVKSGLVFVNWREARGPSQEVKAGDVITVRGRGRVELLEVQETKKERFRVVMNRIS